MKFAIICVLACVAAASAAPLWGPVGHAVTAAVAQSMLTSAASSRVSSILNGQTMASVSSWADQIKSQPGWQWSAALHYINTPDWACNFEYSRDCVNDICVAGAIFNYTKQLYTVTDPTLLQEALEFIIHFVGDIHQPLHVGFTGDQGGNAYHGTFFGHSDNLHQIWDTWIIHDHISNDFNGDQNQYTQYLINQVSGAWSGNATQWAVCPSGASPPCPDAWAQESVGLACSNAYVYVNGTHIANGFVLDEPYYDHNYPVVDQQLAKGGVRLATLLNFIFTS